MNTITINTSEPDSLDILADFIVNTLLEPHRIIVKGQKEYLLRNKNMYRTSGYEAPVQASITIDVNKPDPRAIAEFISELSIGQNRLLDSKIIHLEVDNQYKKIKKPEVHYYSSADIMHWIDSRGNVYSSHRPLQTPHVGVSAPLPSYGETIRFLPDEDVNKQSSTRGFIL